MASVEVALKTEAHRPVPEGVRQQPPSSQSTQVPNGLYAAPTTSCGEAAPKQAASRVVVPMPKEVRRRRNISREARMNGTHAQTEESTAPNTTSQAISEPAATPNHEDGGYNHENTCPQQESHTNGFAVQPAREETATDDKNSKRDTEQAHKQTEGKTTSQEKDGADPVIKKGKENGKRACCMVM
ncbi:hypothetical protein, unknown function [Leishmania tarentolae]|uniref:Uncharacterized protein n=1 Tax=Leishmania tarentolae TaxID=5689 RepID=A0A640KQI5_LEITA|nr:hypothetical protein, unknown function [Leishmania tarentolae]